MHFLKALAIISVTLQLATSFPNSKISSGEEVLVITSSETGTTLPPSIKNQVSEESGDTKDDGVQGDMSIPGDGEITQGRPDIYSFRVTTDVKYRYSKTLVTSRVANRDSVNSQEVVFTVVLPETAFISKFIMEIDGHPYEAYVKEKEEAKKVYNQAQSLGQSAGLVEVSTRNSNTFNVNVNIKARSKVTFNLTYEELLTRRLGKYEQVININPAQVGRVKDFQISVNIEESQNITLLRVPNIRNDTETNLVQEDAGNPGAIINQFGNKATILWTPTKLQMENSFRKQFVFQYDVDRSSGSGEVLVMEGYFVHFFAPEQLEPLRKHVVFVLDVSGSMYGRRIEQLKESQRKILDDLSETDFFNIITFSSDVQLWAPDDVIQSRLEEWRVVPFSKVKDSRQQQPYPATAENIEKAKRFINALVAEGGTNIHGALTTAINLASTIHQDRKNVSEDHVEVELHVPTTDETPNILANTSTSEDFPTTTPVIPSSTRRLQNILPKNVESMIIFLTDGEPTVGVTDPDNIQQLISKANKELSLPIFSLGFGEGADFPFLRKLSLQNYGFARKIYEAADAALQLKGFYNEIASPLLSKVKFNYTSPEYDITELTVTTFPTVFGGTEVAVAGRLQPMIDPINSTEANETSTLPPLSAETTVTVTSAVDSTTTLLPAVAPLQNQSRFILAQHPPIKVAILGHGREGSVALPTPPVFCNVDFNLRPFPPRPTPPPSDEDKFLERLWAYLTIKQLIDEDLKQDPKLNEVEQDDFNPVNPTERFETTTKVSQPHNRTVPETPKQQAVRLALKYGFVTPFTSLVVVKPNNSDVTDAVPADDADSELADRMLHMRPQSMMGTRTRYQSQSIRHKTPSYSNIRYGASGFAISHLPPTTGRPGMMPGMAGIGAHGPYRPPVYFTTRLPLATRTTRPSSTVMPFDNVQHVQEESLEEEYEAFSFETTTDHSLTLKDLHWYNSSFPTLIINGTQYNISSVESDAVESNQGYECRGSGPQTGTCVHLRECVMSSFATDVSVFVGSFFCPITATNGRSNYVGVCCSSSSLTTTATPPLMP